MERWRGSRSSSWAIAMWLPRRPSFHRGVPPFRRLPVLFQNDGKGFSPMSAIHAGITESSNLPLSSSPTDSSITTMTGGRICSSSMATSIRRWISTRNGEQLCRRPLLYHNLKNASSSWFRRSRAPGFGGQRGPRRRIRGHLQRRKIGVVINNMDAFRCCLRNVNPDHHHWWNSS